VLCNQHGFRQWLALGKIMQGWSLVHQEQAEQGFENIKEGLAEARAIGAEFFRTHHLCMLAEAYGMAGRPDEGLTAIAAGNER